MFGRQGKIKRGKKEMKGLSRKKQKRKEKLVAIKANTGKVCKKCGECCKRVSFFFSPASADMQRYYELRGFKITEHEGRKFVTVPVACKNLAENGLCKDYENRPDICRRGYTETRTGVIFEEGCAFK